MRRTLFDSARVWPFWAAGAVFLAAPFETLRPAVSLPGQDLSSVESIFVLAMLAWAAARFVQGEAPRWRSPLTLPCLALVAAFAASALLSAEFPRAAWLFTARQGAGLLFFFVILDAVDSPTRLRRLMVCACLAGTVSAGLGVAEFFAVPGAANMLEPFRLQTYTVGLLPRTSATLQYPTIAAMYLEIVFAFWLGLLLGERRAGDGAPVWVWIGTGATGACLILTLTRSGWIVAAVLLALAAAAAVRVTETPRAGRRVVAVAAALGVLWCGLAVLNASFFLRLTSDAENWYRASYDVPARLEMTAGRAQRVAIRVRNEGLVDWTPGAPANLRVSYHWLTPDGASTVLWDGARTPLPAGVAAGRTLEIEAAVVPPEMPGDYLLVWDMVAEDRFWFSLEGSESGRTRVEVVGPPAAETLPTATAPPSSRFLVSRARLWAIGLRLFQERPWLGIGADNFRLVYGRLLGLETYDLTYHAHNLLIEILVSAGLAGGLALAWLGLRLLAALRRGLASRRAGARPLWTGLALAATAISLHGMMDYFLEFTPTYLMIWGVVGLTAAADRLERSETDESSL